MAEKKVCNNCDRRLSPNQFYNSNSPLFSDGKVPFCKKCVQEMMPEDNLDEVKRTLRQIDKPFLIELWNKSVSSEKDTVGDYFRQINSLPQYKGMTWDDSILYEENDREVENMFKPEVEKIEDIDEISTEHGVIKVTKELRSKWGNASNREIVEMEKLYLDMERANDISTPQHKSDLRFYCKLSVLADKALDEGDFGGYEKLSRQLDSLKKSAGFRAIDRKDGSEASGIRTFSQVYAEIEKDGFIEPYPIQERQDIVDRAIQYMLNYQLKLLNREQIYEVPEDSPKLLDDEILEVENDE